MSLAMILTWTCCSASWLLVGEVPAHACLVIVLCSQLTILSRSAFLLNPDTKLSINIKYKDKIDHVFSFLVCVKGC